MTPFSSVRAPWSKSGCLHWQHLPAQLQCLQAPLVTWVVGAAGPGRQGVRKSNISGACFGVGQFVTFASYGLIFWQSLLLSRYPWLHSKPE